MTSNNQSIFIHRVLVLAALLLAGNLYAQPNAQDIIERMFEVTKRISYSGVFSYEVAGDQRTVKVAHLVVDDHVYEHISYLDGEAKEQWRKSMVDDCGAREGINLQLKQYYRFNILGQYRVAGRDAYKIQVLPIDNHRYAYLFGVDQQTGLMLQSALISQSGHALENFKYIDITFETAPGILSEIDVQKQFQKAQAQPCSSEQEVTAVEWVAAWVPPGFVRSSQRLIGEQRLSLVYTDGISVFSVVIDASPGTLYPAISAKVGPTQMVVTNYTYNDSDYRITLSGELPQATANQIIRSVRPLAINTDIGTLNP
jgi:sigma-E factor negative regulatory protein RseB